jgi:signal transduction histidine kinase
MPLWLIFTFAYLVFVLAIGGWVGYFIKIILPPIQLGSEEFFFSGVQVVSTGVIVLVIIGVLFFILARVTARPTRKLTNAVDEFAKRGVRTPVVIPSFAPKEIRRLTVSFINLMEGVEKAHARDAQISRVKSDFISTAAHQLRTPLTGIRWALEAMGRGAVTPEQEALIKNATDKSKELVSIVGTLLDISAIESGKYQYTYAPTDMVDLAAEVVRDFKVAADEGGVSLGFEPTTGMPLVRADRERMKWVLNNLLENAIRYTPAGGAVRVAVSQSRDRVTVSVRDTGIGIPASDRDNIFERFYRGTNAASKENEGNGLGLYIARTIAADHGGDLNFTTNTEGPGTTFTLSLPINNPGGV